MTKHRRITGLVAIVLFAVAAAAIMRSHPPSTANSVAAGELSVNQRMADLDKLPADNFSYRFPIYLTNR
jgi:hypothetical protein